MIMTDISLQDYCKDIHLSMVYSIYEEKYADNPEVITFLKDALSVEFHSRKINRQMKAIKQAGFPTVKRFEDLILDALPEDGCRSIPDIQSLEFLKEQKT